MKNFISKIKTLDYKQFALQHGEKIGMIVVGLIVVACLALTNWASEYTGTPGSLIDQAEKVDRQVKQNQWTDDRKKEFLPYLTADGELQKVTSEIDLTAYDWSNPLSPRVHEKQLAADEPDWLSVVGLKAHYGQMPMGVVGLPPATEPAADEAKPKPAKGDKKKNKPEELPMPPAAAGWGGGSPAKNASSAEKVRGVRFNVLVGVVEVQKQQRLLFQKLHLASPPQAAARLKYVAFRVQRQRAVPGADPWTGPWKDLSTEASMDVLGEASDFDSELVAAKYTHVEFTSPLPHRLDSDWDPNQVVHPRIPTLTEDEQEQERIKNEAALKTIAETEDADDGTTEVRRGVFSRIQKDANGIRKRATSTDAGSKRLREVEAELRQDLGMGNNVPGRRPMEGGRGPMGVGMGGGPGAQQGADTGADLLLFRYFDFDIEPGECYRYRVQLIVENPSFQQIFVSSPPVAEGEFRETPWSAPSPPAVVDRDVEYALTKVQATRGKYDGAELNVVQFDTSLGTFIMDTFKVAYGAFVGTEKKKTMHLDVAAPTFKEEEVAFSSKDILLDSAGPPNLSNALSDLNLTDPKEVKKLTREGGLDLAVTLNRFGEIVELDAGSYADLAASRKKVDEQRKPYDDIKETEKSRRTKESKEGNKLDELVGDKTKTKTKGRKNKNKGSNPLKGGSTAMAPGASYPGMGMPPGAGAKPAGRGAGAGRAGGIDR